MLEGAFVLLVGVAIGYAVAFFMPKKTDDKYDRYRDENGLLSRKAVRDIGRTKDRTKK